MALADAGVEPAAVDYVNAHATSTPVGDRSEVRALRLALGDEVAARTMVSSTKSMHGHCLGAAGGVEAALTALAIREGMVPPTINLDDLDPDCEGVDHVANAAREAEVRVAVSSAFGFGGHNAILVMGNGPGGPGEAAPRGRLPGLAGGVQPRQHPPLRADARASRGSAGSTASGWRSAASRSATPSSASPSWA